MKKTTKNEPYVIEEDDVQKVLMALKDLRGGVVAVSKDQHPATTKVVLAWISFSLKEIERLTLKARSGPDIIEDLRKEGHDV